MAKAKMIYGGNHPGGALQNMVKEYPNVPSVLKELVQNSIDLNFGGASIIKIKVDFDGGVIEYFDNGPGLTANTFEEAVKTFGWSGKKTDRYGRFGIGLASPLSIGKEFYFTTACSGQRYQSYHFIREKLFAVASGGYPIESREITDIFHGDNKTPGIRPRKAETVWWRTAVTITGLTDDKQKRRFDLDTFQADVQSAYGKKLVELDTKISVQVTAGGQVSETDFKAKLYQGKKLPTWSKTFEDIGKVEVNLHLSPIGYVGPQRIDFGPGDNPSRVPLNKLYLTTKLYGCLGDATKAALNSKLFQGEIVGQNLQLQPNRRSFAEDDAMFAFAIAIDAWYSEVGRTYHEDEKRDRQANRYQTIGLAVIDRLKSTLLSPDSPYAAIFAQAEYGSIGKGHSTVPKKSILPDHHMVGKALIGEKKGFGGSIDGEPRGQADKPKTLHHPNVVIGPQGQERQVVKGHSTGFHMNFGDTGDRMYWFNPLGACITINDTHPAFVAIEKNDTHLDRYYTMLIASALRAEMEIDERIKDANQVFAEGLIDDWVRHVLKA